MNVEQVIHCLRSVLIHENTARLRKGLSAVEGKIEGKKKAVGSENSAKTKDINRLYLEEREAACCSW